MDSFGAPLGRIIIYPPCGHIIIVATGNTTIVNYPLSIVNFYMLLRRREDEWTAHGKHPRQERHQYPCGNLPEYPPAQMPEPYRQIRRRERGMHPGRLSTFRTEKGSAPHPDVPGSLRG